MWRFAGWELRDELEDDQRSLSQDENSVNSELEEALYAQVHYQEAEDEPMTNGNNANVTDNAQDVKYISQVKNKKDGNDQKKSKRKKNDFFNNELEKSSQFVSFSENSVKHRKNRQKNEIILTSSTETEVEILQVNIRSREKKLITIADSSSDDDCILLEDGSLPTDISINTVQLKKESEQNDDMKWEKKSRQLDNVVDNFKDEDAEDADAEDAVDVDISGANWALSPEDHLEEIMKRNRYFRKANFSIRCCNCQQFGHARKHCPDPIKIPHCNLCGEVVHKGNACPNEICTRCMHPGHSASVCRLTRKQLDRKCKICSVRGHDQNSCPDLWRRYYLTTTNGQIVKGLNKTNSRVYCYNCSKKGHWGHECKKKRMNNELNPHTPFIKSYSTIDTFKETVPSVQQRIDESNEVWKQHCFKKSLSSRKKMRFGEWEAKLGIDEKEDNDNNVIWPRRMLKRKNAHMPLAKRLKILSGTIVSEQDNIKRNAKQPHIENVSKFLRSTSKKSKNKSEWKFFGNNLPVKKWKFEDKIFSKKSNAKCKTVQS